MEHGAWSVERAEGTDRGTSVSERQWSREQTELRAQSAELPPSLLPSLPPSLKLRWSKKATVVKESYGGQRKFRPSVVEVDLRPTKTAGNALHRAQEKTVTKLCANLPTIRQVCEKNTGS